MLQFPAIKKAKKKEVSNTAAQVEFDWRVAVVSSTATSHTRTHTQDTRIKLHEEHGETTESWYAIDVLSESRKRLPWACFTALLLGASCLLENRN